MQSLIEFWNRVYYSIYCIYIYIIRAFAKKPIDWLFRLLCVLPAIKRKTKTSEYCSTYKKNIEMSNALLENPSSPFCLYFCSSAMALVLIGPILICAHVLMTMNGTGLRNLVFNHYGMIFITLFILELLFAQFVLWKDERYLKYFTKFKKERRKKRIVWCIGVFLYCIFILIVWFWTLL